MCHLSGLFDASISPVFLVCSLHDFVCSFIRELVVRWLSSYFIKRTELVWKKWILESQII